MPDYQKGKIYKIVSFQTDKIYIGSTVQPLYKRFSAHKKDYKRYLNGTCNYMYSYEIIKYDDVEIILLEDYPCERKEQLHARERYHIESNIDKCFNHAIPTRTHKEYLEIYNEQNKEKLQQQRKEQTFCQCGGRYQRSAKSTHFKTTKHQDYMKNQIELLKK